MGLSIPDAGDGRRDGGGLGLRGVLPAVDSTRARRSIGSSTGRPGPPSLAGRCCACGRPCGLPDGKSRPWSTTGPIARVAIRSTWAPSRWESDLGLFLKSLVFAAGLGLILSLYLWFVVPAEERYMRMPVRRRRMTIIASEFPAGFPGSACCAANEIFHQAADRRGALPRMLENGLLDVAAGVGRVDLPRSRNGLVDLVAAAAEMTNVE